jgi:hypothetical protein
MAHEKQPKAKIMRALSKGVRAAEANALIGGAAKWKDPFDTNDKKINELRKQRVARLPVVRYDFIDALIEEFDKEKDAVAHLGPATSALLARAEKAEADVISTKECWATAQGELQRQVAELKHENEQLDFQLTSTEARVAELDSQACGEPLMSLSVAPDVSESDLDPENAGNTEATGS